MLALHAERLGLCQRPLNPAQWLPLMTPDELYGEAWLLAYEALVRNWLPSATGNNYVSVDAAFGSLESLGVRFYIESAVNPNMRPTGVPPSVGLAPAFSVP